LGVLGLFLLVWIASATTIMRSATARKIMITGPAGPLGGLGLTVIAMAIRSAVIYVAVSIIAGPGSPQRVDLPR
jgi:hypothetical protein